MLTKAQLLKLITNQNKDPEALATALFEMMNQTRSDSRRSEAKDLVTRTEGDALETLNNIANIPKSINDAVDKALESTARMGAAFAVNGPLAKGMAATAKAMNKMFADPKMGAEVFQKLIVGVKGFGQMASAAGLQSQGFTDALGKQASVLQQLGLNMRDYQENVDLAVYSFGMSSKEVQKLNLDLTKLADSFDMLPGAVSRNFGLVAKNLAYDSATIKEQFVKMQQLSLSTGVGVGTIQQKFGTPMDTISGASQAAASINALLGTNAVSATQLLMMPDAERAEFVRSLLQNDDAVMSSLQAGGAEGKFALQTIAKDVLKMDVDTARRFIDTGQIEGKARGEDPGASVKSQVGKKVTEEFSNAAGPFIRGISDLTAALADAENKIKSTQMTPTERFRIEERAIRASTPAGQLQQRLKFQEQYKADAELQFGLKRDTAFKILTTFPGRGRNYLEALELGVPSATNTVKKVEDALSKGDNNLAMDTINKALADMQVVPTAREYVNQVPSLVGQRMQDAALEPGTQERASIRRRRGLANEVQSPTGTALGPSQIPTESTEISTRLGRRVTVETGGQNITIKFNVNGESDEASVTVPKTRQSVNPDAIAPD